MSAAGIPLPEPELTAELSVETALERRRSRRSFRKQKLPLGQLSRLLWVAQGVTGRDGRKRTTPSAGATYPLVVFTAVGRESVEEINAGVYRYEPRCHEIDPVLEGDVRNDLAAAARGQAFLAAAPVTILVAVDYAHTTSRYGERGRRYVHMEAGHLGQNIYLEAESLGLGTVAVGAFRDAAVAKVFGLGGGMDPLYLFPVGKSDE